MKLIIKLLPLLAIFLSCNVKEAVPETVSGRSASLRLHLAASKSALVCEDDEIESLCIGIYSEGRLCECRLMDELDSDTFEFRLEGGREYHIYALANLGTSFWISALSNESSLIMMPIDIRTGIVGKKLPMCCRKDFTMNGDCDIVLDMTRLVSKLNISADVSAFPAMRVTALSIRQAASELYPFNPRQSRFTNNNGDYAITDDIRTLNSGGTITVYVPENLQGTLLPGNTDPYGKNESALMAAGRSAGLCTYVEITGQFVVNTANSPYWGKAKYRFYLGRDLCTNFDIERNSDCTVRFTATERSLTDNSIVWKVDKSEVSENPKFRVDDLSIKVHNYSANQYEDMSPYKNGNSLFNIFQDKSYGNLKAYATFGDGRTEEVTEAVEWKVSGSVSGEHDIISSTGRFQASGLVGSERVTITASYRGASCSVQGICQSYTPSLSVYIMNPAKTRQKALSSETVVSRNWDNVVMRLYCNAAVWKKATFNMSGIINLQVVNITGGVTSVSADIPATYTVTNRDESQIFVSLTSNLDIFGKSYPTTVTHKNVRFLEELVYYGYLSVCGDERYTSNDRPYMVIKSRDQGSKSATILRSYTTGGSPEFTMPTGCSQLAIGNSAPSIPASKLSEREVSMQEFPQNRAWLFPYTGDTGYISCVVDGVTHYYWLTTIDDWGWEEDMSSSSLAEIYR